MLTRTEEPTKLDGESQVASNLSDMHPKLWDLHRKFYLHAWRARHHGRIRRQRGCGNSGPLAICPVSTSCSRNTYQKSLIPFAYSGYGLGPMLFSPMSEIPIIGRSKIYFWTLFIFVLLQLPTGYAVNMPMLLVFRLLSEFFGGPVLATGGATIIDIYPPVELAYWMGIFGASGVLGPVLGPLVGGFAAQAKGWRWTI
jgi:multidrug resistance protein